MKASRAQAKILKAMARIENNQAIIAAHLGIDLESNYMPDSGVVILEEVGGGESQGFEAHDDLVDHLMSTSTKEQLSERLMSEFNADAPGKKKDVAEKLANLMKVRRRRWLDGHKKTN